MYLTDEKTHSAINIKMFKRPNHITGQMYEVELVKSEIEHREPIIVGFFYLTRGKNENVGTLLQFLQKFLWHWQV